MKPNPNIALAEKYQLGVPEIDKQHEELSELVGKFRETVAEKDQRHLIHPVLRRLYHQLSHHFTYEESLMQMVAYPDLSQHRKTHNALLKLLNDHFDDPIAPGDYEFFSKLVSDKVLGHIMEHDAKMIAAIKEKLPLRDATS